MWSPLLPDAGYDGVNTRFIRELGDTIRVVNHHSQDADMSPWEGAISRWLPAFHLVRLCARYAAPLTPRMSRLELVAARLYAHRRGAWTRLELGRCRTSGNRVRIHLYPAGDPPPPRARTVLSSLGTLVC